MPFYTQIEMLHVTKYMHKSDNNKNKKILNKIQKNNKNKKSTYLVNKNRDKFFFWISFCVFEMITNIQSFSAAVTTHKMNTCA